MRITEVLQSMNITHDDKARRVLNTCPDRIADITLGEIEQGITIERLESINVPVYMYGGQITIHGIFKDIPQALRVHGYKSVFHNQNQSLGVKYIAIDADKKYLLETVSRFSKTRWAISKNSSDGYFAFQTFHSNDHDNDKKRLLECYNSTPDNLYIGSKRAVSLMYGGYAVIIGIGAIYQQNLWLLINALTGISSQQEYDDLKRADDNKREAETLKWNIERETEKAARQSIVAEAKQNFTAPNNWVKFDGQIINAGIYAYIADDFDSTLSKTIPVLRVLQCKKHGTGFMVSTKKFIDFNYSKWDIAKSRKHDTLKIKDGWFIPDKSITESQNKPPKTKVDAIDAVDNKIDVTINHNEKLNGVELHFKTKPSQQTLDTLKSNGWRWSMRNFCWYTAYSESNMSFAQQLVS